MGTAIAIRGVGPGDGSRHKREARRNCVSMGEWVHRMIGAVRARADSRVGPSQAFRLYFGPRHGVDLPPPGRQGYRPVLFSDEVRPLPFGVRFGSLRPAPRAPNTRLFTVIRAQRRWTNAHPSALSRSGG